MRNYNKEIRKLEENIRDEIFKWEALWEKLAEHLTMFTKEDLYKLNILDDRMKYYQIKGVLVYHEDTPLYERIKDDSFLRVGEYPEAPLRISFMARPRFDRTRSTLAEWREFRLSHDKGSFIYRLTLPRRDSALKQKIDEETAFIKKLFTENDGKQADQRIDEYMLAKSMEKLLPLLKEREELYEIIRREMGFDFCDLQRLAELEKMRDKLITLESKEERLEFIERYDEYRLEAFKEMLDSRKEIDLALSRLETINKGEKNQDEQNHERLFDLQDYLHSVKKIKSMAGETGNKRIPEERGKTAASARGR